MPDEYDVTWSNRFAENLPQYLTPESANERIQNQIEHGLNELFEEHGRLTNIQIETDVFRSRLEPQCSYLEVEITASVA